MNDIMKIFASLLLILIINTPSFTQRMGIMEEQHRTTVFVDNANVREEANLTSKVVKTLPTHTSIDIDYRSRWEHDTINGLSGYWYPIKEKGELLGYIWEGVLAAAIFKSQLDKKIQFSVHLSSSNKISFGIRKNRVFIGSNTLDCDKERIISVISMGKTYNSKENEVIVVKYFDLSYELFEWNGNKVIKSNIELADESFITGEYLKFNKAIINGNKVNMRSEPDINSKIIKTFDDNQFVKPLNRVFKKDTLNNSFGFWSEVEWKGKVGFIWYKYVDFPVQYIKNNKTESQAFLSTPESFYVFENDVIIAECHEANGFYGDLFEAGNLGLKSNYQFLFFRNYAESCGQFGGDVIYLWDGKKVQHFGENYGIGDGGLSEEHTLIFPIDEGGVEGQIIKSDYDGESMDFPSSKEEPENYRFILKYNNTAILEYNGDSLIELDSKYKTLREEVKIKFPKHSVKQYEFIDLNKDGIEDVLVFIEITDLYNWDDYPQDPRVVIAIGDGNGNYSINYSNKDIINKNYSGVLFEHNTNEFSISIVYKVGYYTKITVGSPKMEKYVFEYDLLDREIYWSSKTEATQENEYGPWDSSTKSFKSNKVKFEEAWINKDFIDYDEY